jgi:glycolate oxidase FAD binding subunit
MTEVTIKTLPRPETEATLLLHGLDDARAGEAMSAAMASSCDVSGAAHLPAAVASRCDGLDRGEAVTVLRLEGVAPSVRHRRDALAAVLKPYAAAEHLEEGRSRALWRALRDAVPFAAYGPAGDRPLWRVSTAPSHGAALAARIGAEAEIFYDWAGGLIWIAMPEADDAGATGVRAAVAEHGGHATLIRAPAAVRAAVAVFEPQSGTLAAVTKRVKDGFDPKGVLNPGRMWAGV